MHAARLVRELNRVMPGVRFFGIGGDKMKAAGVETLYHTDQMGLIGIFEIIRHLPFIRKALHNLEHLMKAHPPDMVVLVDYPGFNLRLARMASRLSIPVFYYIAPQIWAWGAGRIKTMARHVRQVAVILPFEAELFRRAGIDASYVGHPILEHQGALLDRATFFRNYALSEDQPLLGLLPGSRSAEIERLLPVMLRASSRMRNTVRSLQVVIACAPSVDPQHVKRHCDQEGVGACLATEHTHEVMQYSDLLLVASGTATLETAWHGTPCLILYKVSLPTWLLAHILVKIRCVGLVNIVAGKKIVPEFLQGQARPDRVAAEAIDLLHNRQRRSVMQSEMAKVRDQLGEPGASRRTAVMIAAMLQNRPPAERTQGQRK